MVKILYYTDLHKGPQKEAIDSTDVRLLSQYAIHMNMAVLAYAYDNNVDDVIHGGDESTFAYQDAAHHLERAEFIAGSMTYKPNSLHRVIGNHDPIEHLKQLGFQTETYHKRFDDRKNRIIISQPKIEKINNLNIYSYDDNPILNPLHLGGKEQVKHKKRPNIIAAQHWSLDRKSRGYPEYLDIKGYGYHDKTARLNERFAAYANSDLNRVLTLHGHEHRFNMSTNLGFTCLMMPSISQFDVDDFDKPCGLFAEITDDAEDGRLRVTFKKIALNLDEPEESLVETVPQDYMQRYHRPVTIAGLNTT